MDKELYKTVQQKFLSLEPFLNERSKRLWAASEAQALGHGGKTLVSAATGFSRTTIHQGIKEIVSPLDATLKDNVRTKGGGRKSLASKQPEIKERLKEIIESTTCGDPEQPLLWTCKSTRQISSALIKQGYQIGRQKISELGCLQ